MSACLTSTTPKVSSFPTVIISHLDSAKPSLCTFMGLYVVRQLKQKLLVQNQDNAAEILSADFCANVKEALKKRVVFVNELFVEDPQAEEFAPKCSEKIQKDVKALNQWYLPLMPLPSQTVTETCQSFKELFLQMQNKD
jgi:hypothetical protein